MGVRSRLADLRKVFGTAKPAAVSAGEASAGMDHTRPFSPGEPIGPYDGFGRTPRSRDFATGFNIASRPRTHERVAFDTLRGMIEAYDVAQTCIWHRIDSIRALQWSLVPARGFSGDPDEAITAGMAALEKPDRKTRFDGWLAKYLYDVLAYDAGALSRVRNRRGDSIGLRVIDGTTIAPLLDYWGDSPAAPAEAYVQYVQGLPWNWLTRDDLIYEPFRPIPNSPYGRAPLEGVLLNANTDLRFQAYFLQRFTDGNIPQAFASAPETWTPTQIEDFQKLWDSLMYGDQRVKHQIRWMPGGSKITWSDEKDFDETFSLFLMRKTCASYHVVPSDIGFTETVNKSSGETQADVQHRVGDRPLMSHVEGILTAFLRDDLKLPVTFLFDDGQEKEDRLAQAQAWKVYIESGMASADEGREQLLGLPGDPERPTPRFFATTRGGPIPLLAIQGSGGRIDPETFGPAEDQPPLPPPITPIPGIIPTSGTTAATTTHAAEDARQEQITETVKDQTAGITAGTGIVGNPLIDDDRQSLIKSELVAFRRFRQGRRRTGEWRDFEFRAVDPVRGHRLNDAGRLAVRKAAGDIGVAGLCVRAADTGRILMLQRALCDDDPAAGYWEIPGGHLDDGETPLQGAWREWAEETRMLPPPGERSGSWTSADGIYQGIVWTVPDESHVPIGDARDLVDNPDDPDGDQVEAIAWWDPAHLAGNPGVRPELLASLNDVMAALGYSTTATCPCGLPVVRDPIDGWQHADGSISHDDGESVSDKMAAIAKAGGGSPKGGGGPSSADWPAWGPDQDAADHWSPILAAALLAACTPTMADQIVAAYQTDHPGQNIPGRSDRVQVIAAWIALQPGGITSALTDAATGPLTSAAAVGYQLGALAASGSVPDDWDPADTNPTPEAADHAAETVGSAATAIALSRTLAMARILDDTDDEGDTLYEEDPAGQLRTAVGDGCRAAGDILTAITAASTAAAMAAYAEQGVTYAQWAIDPSNPCPICLENQSAGPIRLGDEYPSGHTEPPAHPGCRCAIMQT
jgi:8-oxo-dGTP pyrophosphatase MutT (NUDIX family)